MYLCGGVCVACVSVWCKDCACGVCVGWCVCVVVCVVCVCGVCGGGCVCVWYVCGVVSVR